MVDRLRARLLPTAALVVLAGCSPRLAVDVADRTSLRPLFRLGAGTEGDPSARPVNELRVVARAGGAEGDWDYAHPMWCVGLPSGNYGELAEVRYGVVPEGFAPCSRSVRDLVRGLPYLVVVSGAGSAANAEFVAGRREAASP